GADVVVQVRGNAGPDFLELQKAQRPVMMQSVHDRGYADGQCQPEPPALPETWADRKVGPGRTAHPTVGVDRPHLKPVLSWSEARECDIALHRRFAPVWICTQQ